MIFREAGGKKLKIISTFDSSYSDADWSKRVASGDISVVRLQDNEVELKVAEVKATDAGFYLCQTPSTDSVISGNYEDDVKLIGKRRRDTAAESSSSSLFHFTCGQNRKTRSGRLQIIPTWCCLKLQKKQTLIVGVFTEHSSSFQTRPSVIFLVCDVSMFWCNDWYIASSGCRLWTFKLKWRCDVRMLGADVRWELLAAVWWMVSRIKRSILSHQHVGNNRCKSSLICGRTLCFCI